MYNFVCLSYINDIRSEKARIIVDNEQCPRILNGEIIIDRLSLFSIPRRNKLLILLMLPCFYTSHSTLPSQQNWVVVSTFVLAYFFYRQSLILLTFGVAIIEIDNISLLLNSLFAN